jgi:hypothetical protein
MWGKRENFFSREKKFSLSPHAPLSLSKKAEYFFCGCVARGCLIVGFWGFGMLHAVV